MSFGRIRQCRLCSGLALIGFIFIATNPTNLLAFMSIAKTCRLSSGLTHPNWRAILGFAGGGYGIHWPDLDEDLSTEGLLRSAPAPKASVPAK